MISKKWWLIWIVVLCTDSVFSKSNIQLGCFKPSKSVLLKSYTQRPFDNQGTGHGWCVTLCSKGKYTFAAIQLYYQMCGCGHRLKDSIRVPIKQCTSPCDDRGRCGEPDLAIFYVLDAPPTNHGLLGDSGQSTDKEDGVRARSASKEFTGSLNQLLLLGGVVGAAVTLLAIIVHCARVSRKRSRLLKVYIAQLKRGETDAIPPPSTVAISNELCLSFFCCCYGKQQDDLEYDELLNDLDIEPTHRRSFNAKVNQYLNKCEAEKKENREELRNILRSLSRSSSVAKARSSIRSLAELYLKSRREKQHSDSAADLSDQSQVSLRDAISCPSRVGGRNKNSSASPNVKTFSSHSSRMPMYTKNSLRHGSKHTEPVTSPAGRSGQDVIADDDTLTSQSSFPSRLLPLLCRPRNYSKSSSAKRHSRGSKTRRSRSPRLVRMKGEGLNSSESQSE
ncbi:uncharacterized protein LOC124278548 [Haliotis rubra]|uniref:uncharacterized protein LOC124278548 n=1 Tax=Haliotis rubra TaxID=36100 RepID=UPI001EE51091|nr:uncharacterized protein LOC124278548 [Haliotis rubra]